MTVKLPIFNYPKIWKNTFFWSNEFQIQEIESFLNNISPFINISLEFWGLKYSRFWPILEETKFASFHPCFYPTVTSKCGNILKCRIFTPNNDRYCSICIFTKCIYGKKSQKWSMRLCAGVYISSPLSFKKIYVLVLQLFCSTYVLWNWKCYRKPYESLVLVSNSIFCSFQNILIDKKWFFHQFHN